MSYTIARNETFNSLEISFDGKPSEAIRDALKALRFRWHNVKKVWYGYTDEATARAAIDGKETAPEVKPEDYFTVLSDGYLGAIESTGSKYAQGQRLYGAELSKAIREALKACKIGGVSVSVKTFSGGQEIIIKVKALGTDINSREDFINAYTITDHWTAWYKGLDGKTIHRDYLPWNDAEQMEAIRKLNAAEIYDINLRDMSGSGRDWHNIPDGFMSDAFKTKIAAIKRILGAFNHDDSNGQVDYFDTHFYECITIHTA